MDYSRIFAISAAGMNVERSRVEAAAMNLANANTVLSTDGTGYQPMRVEARAAALAASAFAERIDLGLEEASGPVTLVPQASVEPTHAAPRLVHDPGNPFADARGDVSYPGVDTATEMLTLMRALRSYQANVAAMNITRSLALKTLDIGGGT